MTDPATRERAALDVLNQLPDGWHRPATDDPVRMQFVARFRTVIVGACVLLATLTAGACGPVSERTNGQRLACGQVPEDVCVRLADNLSEGFARRNPQSAPIVKLSVTPTDCPGGLPAVRCWHVEGTTAAGAGSAGVYYQRADGALIDARNDSPVGG